MELRDYQQKILQQSRDSMRRGNRRLLLCSPTGSGKTAISSHIVKSASEKGLRCGFLCHRKELIEQTDKTFKMVGIEAGIIAAGTEPDYENPVQIASIDTLYRRRDKVPPFDLLVIDEAVHITARTWRSVVETWPDAWRIGLTATPRRLSGEGFDDLFDDLIMGPRVRDLISDGWLAPFRLFAPPTVDTTGLPIQAGEYATCRVDALVNRKAITGDVIEHYRKLADGKQAVVFCASVQHSLAVRKEFLGTGYKAAHIDGKTPPAERARIIDAFKQGDYQVLTNVNLVTEGFDVPGMEVCILLRPTRSLAMYLQMVGRVLRPAENKTALILDHVGNVREHGMPDHPHEWTLIGKTRSERREYIDEAEHVAICVCDKCYGVYEPGRSACPYCEAEAVAKYKPPKVIEGELKEIELAAKHAAKLERMRARSYEALIEIGIKRGYAHPHAWARHVFSARD